MPFKTQKASGRHSAMHFRLDRWTIMNLVVFGLLMIVLVPATSGLNRSLAALGQADVDLIVAAAGCVALTYCFAALTYKMLALKPVKYLPTLCIQIAGGFVNRLLPAGLGGLGINLLYLKKKRHALPAATAVVSANNFVGFLGNITLITLALLLTSTALPKLSVPRVSPWVFGLVAGLVLLGVFVSFIRHGWSGRLRRFLHRFGESFALYGNRKRRFMAAIFSSMVLTGLHVAALYLVSQALGLPLVPVQALLAVSVGAIAGALVPTPGGLGGAEAGLLAVIVSFGIPPESGLTAVLTYRLLTFWLPLLPGFLMLQFVEKRYL